MCRTINSHGIITEAMMKKARQKYRYSMILLRELVITDFRIRYQSSFLGYLWSVLRPLFLFSILYLVFVVFLRIGRDIPNWPIALLLGIVMWNFFTEVASGGLRAVVNRGGLMRKINFPKYIVVISGTISALINLGLNLVVVLIFMMFSGVELMWTMPLFVLPLFEVFLFGLGMAFLLGTLNVKYKDTQYLWEVITRGMFYASAVLYPISRIAEKNLEAAQLLLMNPVAQAIQDARWLLVTHEIPTLSSISHHPSLVLIPIAISVATLVWGALYFRSRSPYFAEEI